MSISKGMRKSITDHIQVRSKKEKIYIMEHHTVECHGTELCDIINPFSTF